MTLAGPLTTATVLALGLALTGQNLPPELRKRDAVKFDPVLPDAMRPAVVEASKAELDAKRGVGNAVQILKAERRKFAGDRLMEMALDLRIAASVLRARFSNNNKVETQVALQQALSTYSKLDLTEPGLNEWLNRTIAATAEVDPVLADRRPLKIALLVRGAGLDKRDIETRLNKALDNAGFSMTRTPVKQADFVLKLASDQVREEDGTKPVVRVTLGIEQLEAGRVEWRQGFFRTSEAPKLDTAIAANLDWLVRIGGRDMLFRWFTEKGLSGAVVTQPGGDHAGHGHGPGGTPGPGTTAPRVRLPSGGRTEPAPPKVKGR